MPLLRHIPFLKAVTLYSFTAFGGPHGHLGMMMKTFAHRRKDVTEEEIVEYNAFCQMLPGASSTQTVMLIAMKRGGIPLAIVTLLIWVLPAFLIMTACSFFVYYYDNKKLVTDLFSFIRPMSVGFVAFAATRMTRQSVKHTATICIMAGALLATVLIRSPWVFPAILIVAGAVSNFSDKRIPVITAKPKKIMWINLWLFGLLFIGAGIVSELARTNNWPHKHAFNLFENFYRFGSIVFGGGSVLLPMMLYQFVYRPMKHNNEALLSGSDLLTGYGLMQAAPGPVFSICGFAGGLVMSQEGPVWQLAGCFIATIAVFLPGTLLLFFLFPIYQNLKQHVIIFRALEGIYAAITGIIWASGIVLLQSLGGALQWTDAIIVAVTFLLLNFTKLPAPIIVLGWMLLGLAMHFR